MAVLFVLCWSPYIVFDLLQVYGFVPQTPTNVAVATLIQSLAPLNSAANPVIYCLFSTPICRNIRQKWSTTKSTFTISSKNPSAGLGGGGGGGGGGMARVQTVAAKVEQEQQPPPPLPPPLPPPPSSSSSRRVPHSFVLLFLQVLLGEGEEEHPTSVSSPTTGTHSCPNQLRGEWEYKSEGKKRCVRE
ncbi:hypothetical protein Pcinc_021405 [Petrolisthes cinctipes]|uniref:G-protein coupled receptors family 1 profile domain-containing protein n=1 Tax=Petrolisthes cinctipes TaxID=88211 RepID=A0AAE1FH35_PETCI|nr:hypothetical protein Pcinc_021405 [Petrolisthes cinctipes]